MSKFSNFTQSRCFTIVWSWHRPSRCTRPGFAVEEFANDEQHTEGTSVVETPPVEEISNEEQHTEGTSIVETPPVEEFAYEEQHTEGISVVETPLWRYSVHQENQGRRKMFFGKSKVVKSSEDRLRANNPTKQGNDEHEQVSSTLPLHTGQDWYVERGRNESNRSTVSGTLQQNLEAIKEKIEEKKCWKEKSRLVGVKAVGEQMYKFPIISTQEAARIFFNASKETEPRPSCDEAIKRKNSMEIYEALSKHLNLLQVYIHGKAFLIENRSSPLIEVVSNLKNIFDSFDFRARLNSHIDDKIGDCYKTALAYLDTKRDRDTVKYLLTQIWQNCKEYPTNSPFKTAR